VREALDDETPSTQTDVFDRNGNPLLSESQKTAHSDHDLVLADIGLDNPLHDTEPITVFVIEFPGFQSGCADALPLVWTGPGRRGRLLSVAPRVRILGLRAIVSLFEMNPRLTLRLIDHHARLGPFIMDRGLPSLLDLYFWGISALFHVNFWLRRL